MRSGSRSTTPTASASAPRPPASPPAGTISCSTSCCATTRPWWMPATPRTSPSAPGSTSRPTCRRKASCRPFTGWTPSCSATPRGLRDKPVRIHISGLNEWREFESFPPGPPTARSGTSTPARCCRCARSGPPPPDIYHYDPRRPDAGRRRRHVRLQRRRPGRQCPLETARRRADLYLRAAVQSGDGHGQRAGDALRPLQPHQYRFLRPTVRCRRERASRPTSATASSARPRRTRPCPTTSGS